jgi:hypothetical protein
VAIKPFTWPSPAVTPDARRINWELACMFHISEPPFKRRLAPAGEWASSNAIVGGLRWAVSASGMVIVKAAYSREDRPDGMIGTDAARLTITPDHRATFEVSYPSRVSDEQRESLTRVAKWLIGDAVVLGQVLQAIEAT